MFFTIGFGISGLIFYHQSFIWPKWRAFSLACAIGCFMESGGRFRPFARNQLESSVKLTGTKVTSADSSYPKILSATSVSS